MIQNINISGWFNPRTLTLEYCIVFKLFTNIKQELKIIYSFLNERIGDFMLDKVKYMKVEKKLKYCLTLVVIIASISSVFGLIFLFYNNIQSSAALVNNGFSQGEIGTFSTYLNKEPTIIREIIIFDDEENMQAAAQQLEEAKTLTNEAYTTMKEHCNTEKEVAYLNTIESTLSQYREIYSQVVEHALAGHDEEAYNMMVDQGKPVLTELTNAVESLIDLNKTMGNNVSKRLQIQTYIIAGIMVIVVIIAIIISMKIAGFVAKLFADPIIKVKDASAKLAQGDLKNIVIEKLYPDEIGDMTDSFKEAIEMLKSYISDLDRVLSSVAAGNFNVATEADFKGDFVALDSAISTITNSLSDTIGNINEASEQVALGASQMAESAQSLAEGATDQAASVEELTATIQNITETVVISSEKANQSYISAQEYEQAAEKSNEDIKQLNSAMECINDTSKQIANIIAEIEDIASQTNLLSLNASIEAARAGEAGKGFAVVADQIAKLASDSANSAVNTKQLIENSISEIETGNEITAKATTAIESVINGIKMLASSTKEISDLSVSQAEAMRQLEEGVEQISEVIQNNSAAAQETSATSEELSAQSETLEQLVRQFQLKI